MCRVIAYKCHKCLIAPVPVRGGQFSGVHCVILEMNSDRQTQWQAPLPDDPSHLPQSVLFKWSPWTRITRQSPASLRPLSFVSLYKEELQSIWRTKPKLRENCPRGLVFTCCGCASHCGRIYILAPAEYWAPFTGSGTLMGLTHTTQHDIYPAFPHEGAVSPAPDEGSHWLTPTLTGYRAFCH